VVCQSMIAASRAIQILRAMHNPMFVCRSFKPRTRMHRVSVYRDTKTSTSTAIYHRILYRLHIQHVWRPSTWTSESVGMLEKPLPILTSYRSISQPTRSLARSFARVMLKTSIKWMLRWLFHIP